MKSLLIIFAFISQSAMAATPSLEGDFVVTRGCEVNNMRIGVLNLMYESETNVTLKIGKEYLEAANWHRETAKLPLGSNKEIDAPFFKDYYKRSDVIYTRTSYSFSTSGSEFSMCDNYPLPGKHPCRKKWDDEIVMKVNASGGIDIQWRIDSASGRCQLERKN